MRADLQRSRHPRCGRGSSPNWEKPAYEAAERALWNMHRVCTNNICRHRALSAYFGQELTAPNCGACDVCLGEISQVEDPITLGQKILSCVLRLDQRFGADYTAKVLTGSSDSKILQFGHDRLSTYGLLKDERVSTVRGWIEQLVAQQFLVRQGEYQTLKVTASGSRLLKREETPQLSLPPQRKAAVAARGTQAEAASMVGVDTGLMDHLRKWRLSESQRRSVPAYVLFGDATLRELARMRPSTLVNLRQVKGIGEQKLREIGQLILDAIEAYSAEHPDLERDVLMSEATVQPEVHPAAISITPGIGAGALAALPLFRQGLSLDEVCAKMGRARSTVSGYLAEYIRIDHVTDPARWVSPENIATIESVLHLSEDGRLKPIFDALEGKISYEDIRIVITCREQRGLA